MKMTPENYMERLNKLLQNKKALLLDILSLTRQQSGVISEDGLDSLNKLIDDKQKKIDAIDKLDDEFNAHYSKLKTVMGITGLDQLDASKIEGDAAINAIRLKTLTADILDIIRDISGIEKENSKKSAKLLEKFGNEIKKLNQSKKVNNAYTSGNFDSLSYFIDKKK